MDVIVWVGFSTLGRHIGERRLFYFTWVGAFFVEIFVGFLAEHGASVGKNRDVFIFLHFISFQGSKLSALRAAIIAQFKK